MAALIVFGSLRGKDTADDRVKVKEDAAAVAKALAGASDGFASFQETSSRGGTIWVNVAQVRAVREAKDPSNLI
jgi:hypothetical protein